MAGYYTSACPREVAREWSRRSVGARENGAMNPLEECDVSCPSCGEVITVLIDLSVTPQTYTEDCQVCCSPMVMCVGVDDEGGLLVTTAREDE